MAIYRDIGRALEKLVGEEKGRLVEAIEEAAQSLPKQTRELNIGQEFYKLSQRTGKYYQRGRHFLDGIANELKELELVERLSYLRGLMQSLEQYEGGSKLVEAAGFSEQELYGSRPERTRSEEKAILEDTRAALRGGSLDGQCNYCRKKVDSETCLIRLPSPASNDGTIYCDDGCFTMYTED